MVKFISATQSCPTLYDRMNCSMPGFPVHNQLPELAQTHAHQFRVPFNHLCHPLLLLLPKIFPTIRIFSNESFLHIRWPKYWNFSFSISPSNEYLGLISFSLTGLIWQSKGFSRVFSNTTVQKASVLRRSAFFMI